MGRIGGIVLKHAMNGQRLLEHVDAFLEVYFPTILNSDLAAMLAGRKRVRVAAGNG